MAEWTIEVSDAIDANLRSHLAKQGGDLNAYVSEAVQRKLLRDAVNEVRAQNIDLSAEEARTLVDEAVDWARANRS